MFVRGKLYLMTYRTQGGEYFGPQKQLGGTSNRCKTLTVIVAK